MYMCMFKERFMYGHKQAIYPSASLKIKSVFYIASERRSSKAQRVTDYPLAANVPHTFHAQMQQRAGPRTSCP